MEKGKFELSVSNLSFFVFGNMEEYYFWSNFLTKSDSNEEITHTPAHD